jgi:hypothetical protein
MRTLLRTCAIGCTALGLASGARAAQIDIGPSADNTLYETLDGSLSNGAGSYVFSGATATGELRRALFLFDVASFLPAGAVVSGAELLLYMSKARAGEVNRSMSLHRLNTDWGEGSSTAASVNEGIGGASASGDATWIHTFYATSQWATPGGDFVGASSGSAVVAATIGAYSWTGPGLVTDVQSWLDGSASDYGWILLGDEGSPGSARRFNSADNAANAPILRVTYQTGTVPEPASAALLTLVVAGIAVGARRRA